MTTTFPPPLAVGSRVWTEDGYYDHGPLEGPKVNIPRRTGGVITNTERPYYTMDHVLYTVQWDNGQLSKHYSTGLFCIGRFQTRTEFEAAIQFVGEIHLTLGPRRGFKGVQMRVQYDGTSMDGRLYKDDRDLWNNFFERLAKRQKIPIRITKLPSSRGENT